MKETITPSAAQQAAWFEANWQRCSGSQQYEANGMKPTSMACRQRSRHGKASWRLEQQHGPQACVWRKMRLGHQAGCCGGGHAIGRGTSSIGHGCLC